MYEEIEELETPPEYLYLDECQEELSQNDFQVDAILVEYSPDIKRIKGVQDD